MSLTEELKQKHEHIKGAIGEVAVLFDEDTQKTVDEGVGTSGPGIGDPAPGFELTDQTGKKVSFADLTAQGPLVISFYRGGWCPYCNLELRALQMNLEAIKAMGANLVAITPELPDESMSTAEKNELAFPVLSDVGNVIARAYGLVFSVSEELRPHYANFGIDLPKTNGDDSFELPVPGTYVIDQDGIIRASYVNADYKTRMDPDDILKALDAIS